MTGVSDLDFGDVPPPDRGAARAITAHLERRIRDAFAGQTLTEGTVEKLCAFILTELATWRVALPAELVTEAAGDAPAVGRVVAVMRERWFSDQG